MTAAMEVTVSGAGVIFAAAAGIALANRLIEASVAAGYLPDPAREA